MPGRTYAFPPFRLDLGQRHLLREGEPVPLTPKAFETLVLLVENRDRAMKKAELMRALWPDRVVEEATLTQNVFTLRKALGDDSEPHRYIATVPRYGYRFVAELSGPAPEASIPRRGVSRRVWAAAGTLALVAAVGAAWLLRSSRTPKTTAASLAVLPFVNASEGSNGDYLADGLTEGLITDTARLPRLRVIARTTAFQFRNRRGDARRVGRELGVESVLTGRVAVTGEHLDVEVELLSVATGMRLWERHVSAGLDELAEVEQSLARDVALHVPQAGEAPAAPTSVGPRAVDGEAYRLYLEARYFWNRRTADGLRRSVDLFRAATKQDPEYALAFSGMADAYAVLPEFSDTRESEAYPAAREAAQKALSLDDSLAEAHTSLAFVRFWWDRDQAGAESEFKHAIDLNPGYPTAHHWYGNALLAMGRVEESIVQLREAQTADPLSLIILAELGSALYHARRYEEAIEQLRHVIELDERFAPAHYWLGRALLYRGQVDEAITEYRREGELTSDPVDVLGESGNALARAGRVGEARQRLRDLEALRPARPVGYNEAVLYSGLGEVDRAFEALDRAFAERVTDLSFIGTDPVFDRLRPDPRFALLMKRLRLPRS